jgi:hypothetical protein
MNNPVYLEQSLGLWKRRVRNMGIPLGDNRIYTLHFADDQVLIAQGLDDIEYLTRKLIVEYKKWGLEIRLDKTLYVYWITRTVTFVTGMR